jgi:hypothetical protein
MAGTPASRTPCRIVLVTGIDPEDTERERLIIVGEKSNIGEVAPPLAFRKAVNTHSIDDQEIEAVSLAFDLDQDLDRLRYTADYLLAAPPSPEDAAKVEVAMDFLAQTLGTAGERMPSEAVKKTAATLGIAKRTLERARKALKVRPEKQPDGTWSMWVMPKDHPMNIKARRRGAQ